MCVYVCVCGGGAVWGCVGVGVCVGASERLRVYASCLGWEVDYKTKIRGNAADQVIGKRRSVSNQ